MTVEGCTWLTSTTNNVAIRAKFLVAKGITEQELLSCDNLINPPGRRPLPKKRKKKVSEACKKEKSRSNGNQKSGNTHKARQITGAETPEDTDDESNDHKVCRTIVTCNDSYKVYRTTGELSLIHI